MKITKDTLVQEVIKRKLQKKSTSKIIMEVLNCTKKDAKRLAADIIKNPRLRIDDKPVYEVEYKPLGDNKVINKSTYTYNKETDKYIVTLKSAGRDIVVPGEKHRAMLDAYSHWDGQSSTINEICRLHEFPRTYFSEYKTLMGWTHDSLPITKEDLRDKTEDQLITDLLQRKAFNVTQELQKKDWQLTQLESIKWREFKAFKLDPFEAALKNFNPKEIEPLEFIPDESKAVKNTFVLGLSDLHFGAKANAEELYAGKDFNSKVLEDIMDKYIHDIATRMSERTYRFESCAICVMGDILHTLNGKTVKGTQLESEVLREDQYALAFNCLIKFIQRMKELFGKVDVHVVKGNHSGPDEYLLFSALSVYFRSDTNIVFNLYRAHAALIRIKNTAILLDHGASDAFHAAIPKGAKARESHVQGLLLQYPEKLVGCKSRLMIQGDKHHFEQIESKGFEYFMFSSAVTGDRFADHYGLNSRPRQNCLVLDENGVADVLHFYFD